MFRKIFAAAFTFIIITVHVTAEIPSYIHVCGRRDPNLDKCILNNIENLKDKICEGIPELNIPSNNPLFLDKVIIFDTPKNKLYIKDTKLIGICDFVVNYFHIDIDKLHIDIDLSFKQLQLNGTYDANLHLLLSIVNKGQFYITTDNVGVRSIIDLKLVTKNDQKYIYVSKVTLNFDIKGYNIDFLNTESIQWTEIAKNFVNQKDTQKEFIKISIPSLQQIVSERMILLSNNIVKLFTYDELFPDRT